MKILNTVLSAVLLIAVIVLFTKVYGGEAKPVAAKKANSTEQLMEEGRFTGSKIAYVNSDTLVKKYEYQQELSKTFEAKAKKVEAELARRSQVFQDEYRLVVEQSKTLSPEQLQRSQAELQQIEQGIMQYRDQQTAQLQQEEAQLTQLIMDDVRVVLKEVKAELSVDYILSKGPGSNVMAANEDFDITPMVLERLNKMYAEKKQAQETKK